VPHYPNVNEQEQTAAFEQLCGGVEKAQRLFKLWKNSRGYGTAYDIAMGRGRTKEQVFTKRACEEGFTTEQCYALMRLQ
jgi:hypothetical protein